MTIDDVNSIIDRLPRGIIPNEAETQELIALASEMAKRDIVERLREHGGIANRLRQQGALPTELSMWLYADLHGAANEIESLRNAAAYERKAILEIINKYGVALVDRRGWRQKYAAKILKEIAEVIYARGNRK